MMRVKKNDTVVVLTGKDRGKKGLVLDILLKKGKVLIKGIGLNVKHVKARKQGEVSTIKKIESYVDLSNVMPFCSSCKKPSRVGSKKLEKGEKARICKRCGEVMV